MRTRRIRTMLGLGALLGALLVPASCANEDAGHIVIHIATWGGAGDDGPYDRMIQQLYREFEKENPGIEVREEAIPDGYVSKMILSFIAKAEPDIMMLDFSSAAVFINNGVLTDLTPIIKKDPEFKVSDFFPNAINAARRGESLYAIPKDFTPVVVYYNKRMFEKAGVPFPKPGWNFQQFLETAQKLTIPEDKPGDPLKQAGFAFKNWMAGWVMWLWNNGGDVLSPDGKTATGYFDSPKNVETIQFLADLIDKYHVSNSISAVSAQGVDPFANGQAAMAVSGHWSMVDYGNAPKDKNGKPKITWDDIGVVEMPHNTPDPHTVVYEAGFAIGKNCKHKDLAWKLIKFVTSYKFQLPYNASGIAVCARKDVAEERSAKSALEASFLPIIPSTRPPWGSKIEGYEFVESTGEAAMDSILQNNKPVDQALHEAASQIDFEFTKK